MKQINPRVFTKLIDCLHPLLTHTTMKNTMLVILLAALASITAVAVESAAKPYPLDMCIVSDE